MRMTKKTGSATVGAVVAGLVAAGGLATAPAANASCASFFGIGNSAGCVSNRTSIAIAIGDGATATANGLFGAAFAVGTNTSAVTESGGVFNLAANVYPGSEGRTSIAGGTLSAAVAVGRGDNPSGSYAGAQMYAAGTTQVGNFALGPQTFAGGTGNLAVNLFSTRNGSASAFGTGSLAVVASKGLASAQADGVFNVALTAFGSPDATSNFAVTFDNEAYGPSKLGCVAISLFNGGNNYVNAGGGPFAVAASIGQSGQDVRQKGPGININNTIKTAGATAARPASKRTAKPAASAGRSAKPAAGARTAQR